MPLEDGDDLKFEDGRMVKSNKVNDPRSGTLTLINGQKTVLDPSVTDKTVVQLSRKLVSGTIESGLSYSVSPGVGFTVTSVGAVGGIVDTDNSTVGYSLIEGP